MKRRRVAPLAGLCAVVLALSAAPVGAAVIFHMRVWLLPPMDVTGATTCFTNRWHSANGHALDWNKDCGYGSSANVYFRAQAQDEDGAPAAIAWAQGEPYQLANQPCGTGTVREARVRIRSQWDGLVKGYALYAHALVSRTTAFDIFFGGRGTYWDDSLYNSIDIADTKSDAGAGSSCWTGYHVHENNVTSSAWDRFNTVKWDTAPTSTGYDNDYIGNWTRSLGWIDD
jgi:hypothetical protein